MGQIYVPSGQLIVPDRIGQGGEFIPPAVWVNNFTSNAFATSSAVNVPLLDAVGGNPITLSGSKSADDLLVFISFIADATTTQTVVVGVNDGAVDWDVASIIYKTNNDQRPFAGERRVTGLPAGPYTLTLFVRTSAGTMTMVNAYPCTVRALEIQP